MVAFVKINDFVEDLIDGIHDLDAHSIRIALSNTAPASETSNPTADGNGILANVTQIAYTNYTDDLTVDRVLEGIATTLSSGTATFDVNDVVITASGGAIATFRYIYVYNDTPTSPADPLICIIDNEAAIDLADGESVTITINASGLFTVA